MRVLRQEPVRPRNSSDLPLVAAALRRRRAERAFEDYVRELARRWRLGADHEDAGGGGEALPRV
jgi:hypothetical protein